MATYLGINYSIDSAASLVVDGAVVAAVQEERLSRIKHDSGFPQRAVRFCLDQAGLSLSDVDGVGFFWNPGIHAEPANWRMASVPRDHLEYLYQLPVHLMRHFDGLSVERVEQRLHLEGGHTLAMHYLTHHPCHAAAAFYRSNYPSAAVLTVDGYGERASTSIFRGERSAGLQPLLTVDFPHSVGAFYAAFTQYLGFRPNSGEGKAMGLASYGDPEPYYQRVRELVRLHDDGFELDLSYFDFYLHRRRRYGRKLVELLGPERSPESEITQRQMDIAAAMQRVTEELVLHLGRLARARSGEQRLCMAGGVTLNCVANTRLRFEAGFDEAFFLPAASDAGTSMGAALYLAHVLGDDPPVEHPYTDALGPGYDDEEIERVLKLSGCRYERPERPCERVAELLEQGKIVGFFQGRAEFGPRALGQRSILADPRRAEMKDVLNARVKFREWFRPFAPAVLEQRCGELFGHDDPAPFMLLVYPTRAEQVAQLGAVTHVDGGARVQTVNREQNAPYYDVIEAFGARTGVPVVLNTSFNIRGEPIVTTVQDALKCYFTTDMDALNVGPFVLEK